ncbi:MAG TPA: DNA primase [Candidatus Omnitrophota bacterium]|nr:DNA primase [Candidatus Omnitrophota bacterium]
MIPEAVLNQIQDRVDIVEVISAYVQLKRAGRNFKACCPFHPEKTPSFMVNPDKQIYHCFGCGVGGNVFSFLMKEEKKDFREVVEMLAERVGVELPKTKADFKESERGQQLLKASEFAADFFQTVLLKSPEAAEARGYLTRRGLTQATIEKFKIGFAPSGWDKLYNAAQGKTGLSDAALERTGLVIAKKEGGYYDRFRSRIMFPITDPKGLCVAFGGRVMDDSQPKYLNSPESEIYSKGRQLYGLFQGRKAIREADAVMVVEGYMDLVACHQAGFENVVASCGTALTPDQARLIKRHTRNVIMLYDADKAGESATLRGLETFLEEEIEVKIVRLPAGHDPDSFIKEFGADKFRASLAAAKDLFRYRLDLLKDQHNSEMLEGRVKIANEMVLLFSKVTNAILRSVWMKELASELSLSEEALLAEVQKANRRVPAGQARSVAPAVSVETVRQAERMLLGLFFEPGDFVDRAREEIRPDDFENPKARQIAKKILDGEGRAPSAAQLVSFYEQDPESAQIVTLACAEMDSVVDKEKTFNDCVLWFKQSRIKNRREGLRAEIQAAQMAGDMNRVSKLLYDFNELTKGIQKNNEKK